MDTERPTRNASPLADFCTISAAATRLGVDKSTVWRWVNTGRLKAYRPHHAAGERTPDLLLRAEVDEFDQARRLVKGG